MKESSKDGVIRITRKRPPRGEDGHKIFSVRMPDATVSALDALAIKSNRSRNELINIFIDWGLAHTEITE